MKDRNENRPGYKKTKIGWIPEDWEVVKLENTGTFSKGAGLSKSELVKNGYPVITYGEIYYRHNYYIKKIYSHASEKSVKNSSKIKYGDILFAGSGETLDEIGKCVAYLFDYNAYAGGDIIIFTPKNNEPKYLGFLLNQDVINRQKYKLGQGHSVVHIYTNNIKDILIPLPPLPEQKKIAAILSAWDRAIEKTEELIKAKEKLKKGLMQKLLTGRVRFSEFVKNPPNPPLLKGGLEKEVKSQEAPFTKGGGAERGGLKNKDWYKISLKKCLKQVSRPIEKPMKPYYALGIRSHGKGTFIRHVEEYKNVMMDTLYQVKENDLIINITFAWEGAIALVKKSDEIGLVSHRFPTYEFNKSIIIPEFFKQIIITKRFVHMLGLISPGGAGRNRVLDKKDLLRLEIEIPLLEEQTRIASVLSTSDREIELLKKKLEDLKKQKKGLMQKLLTGEIRVRV